MLADLWNWTSCLVFIRVRAGVGVIPGSLLVVAGRAIVGEGLSSLSVCEFPLLLLVLWLRFLKTDWESLLTFALVHGEGLVVALVDD